MYESVLQGALDLPLEQKKSLIECLKGAALAQMASVREGEPAECPRCRHGHVVRGVSASIDANARGYPCKSGKKSTKW